jgi:hypothetical protein
LFHTEAAKLFRATDEEIQEAVHYAKTSLGRSACVNGMREAGRWSRPREVVSLQRSVQNGVLLHFVAASTHGD